MIVDYQDDDDDNDDDDLREMVVVSHFLSVFQSMSWIMGMMVGH